MLNIAFFTEQLNLLLRNPLETPLRAQILQRLIDKIGQTPAQELIKPQTVDYYGFPLENTSYIWIAAERKEWAIVRALAEANGIDGEVMNRQGILCDTNFAQTLAHILAKEEEGRRFLMQDHFKFARLISQENLNSDAATPEASLASILLLKPNSKISRAPAQTFTLGEVTVTNLSISIQQAAGREKNDTGFEILNALLADNIVMLDEIMSIITVTSEIAEELLSQQGQVLLLRMKAKGYALSEKAFTTWPQEGLFPIGKLCFATRLLAKVAESPNLKSLFTHDDFKLLRAVKPEWLTKDATRITAPEYRKDEPVALRVLPAAKRVYCIMLREMLTEANDVFDSKTLPGTITSQSNRNFLNLYDRYLAVADKEKAESPDIVEDFKPKFWVKLANRGY